MNGNEIVDNIINMLPIIIENFFDFLFPENVQVWFSNNYKLIGLIFLLLLMLCLTIVVIKDISNRSR